MARTTTTLVVLGISLALLALGIPASGHHGSRVDTRIVQPYGVQVVLHIPILAGYEPVPTPQHCLPGVSALPSNVYNQNFEGAHGYTFLGTPLAGGATNNWQATTYAGAGSDTGHTGATRLYFGNTATGYMGSGHVAGTARSPGIAIPASGIPVLSFATKWNTEWLKGYDHLWVEALDTSTGKVHLLCTSNAYDRGDASSSGDFHKIGSCSPVQAAPCYNQLGLAWETRSVELPLGLRGKTIQLQFTYDSSDNVANNFMGWMVDDVKVGTV